MIDRGQLVAQQHILHAASQINRADQDRIHLIMPFRCVVRQQQLGDFQCLKDRVFFGRDGEGRAGEIPFGRNTAGHDVANKARILIDLGRIVQALFGNRF